MLHPIDSVSHETIDELSLKWRKCYDKILGINLENLKVTNKNVINEYHKFVKYLSHINNQLDNYHFEINKGNDTIISNIISENTQLIDFHKKIINQNQKFK